MCRTGIDVVPRIISLRNSKFQDNSCIFAGNLLSVNGVGHVRGEQHQSWNNPNEEDDYSNNTSFVHDEQLISRFNS